jgi:prepilin-type N-terminal cleavage/methylation domain-containing protein
MRNGFTLIEILIVIAISALLSTIAIFYTGAGQNTVALSVEEAKISQLILEAKELSISTYGASGVCGYGVNIDMAAQTYSLFSYIPGTPTCPDVSTITGISGTPGSGAQEGIYTQGTLNIPVSKGVIIQATDPNTGLPYPDSLYTVLFYPPDPAVFLSHDNATFPGTFTNLAVHLETSDGTNNDTILVNSQGQVSF